MNNTPRKGTLPIVVLRDTVLFPRVGQQLDIVRPLAVKAVRCAVDTGQDICIVMQKNPAVDEPEADDLHMYGIIASVRQVFKHPSSGTMRIRVECICRATVSCVEKKDGMLTGYAAECAEITSDSEAQSKADRRLLKNLVKEYVHRSEHKQARVIMDSFDNLDDLGALTDFLAHTLTLNGEQKQILLSTLEHHKRCERMMAFINDELSIFRLQNEIEQKVQANMDRNQREYYLREQMKVIAEELGDGDSPLQDADMYREKISAINASDEVKDQLFKSCDKLAKLPSGSHEASVERNYLDACLALPWGKLTKDKLNVAQAAKKLDKDHYGMKKVKDRILEFIAVRALAPDIKGQIICLAGPPGVGKTSIARSVAEALGKKYCRVALGGIHDEADIRGHRKTYIGSMPGRIANALKLAGTCNPLILLDEVDKLASDFRGDPTSALLEVLDPEQNSTFHDHYIDLPIDLSNVMFITTANDYGRIPAPLLDRMEVIELPSYTLEEKLNIAKRHLVKKQLSRHGLSAKQLRITDKALTALIDGYTREAGVRSLEREIASVCRKVAKKIALGETDKV
ncbi:MAG: endopeptidase La, partial [Clostridia bacterium]|nr:endopeptidase La [Clostridia bacterium]